MANKLLLHNIVHRFDGKAEPTLKNIDLSVAEGQIHFLLGPSGCGKTTLLRLIAGLERIQDGEIVIDGMNSHHLPAKKRRVGLVFQDHALFPNLTARENVAFGLKQQHFWPHLSQEEEQRVDAMILRFGLDAVAEQYPDQLSGGQQQRVGIARAIIAKPALLLLDEPFSNLDSRTKDRIRDDILHLLQATQTSALIVSHDPQDALHIADWVSVFTPDGRISQSASPEEIFHKPNSRYVAEFMGEVNTIPGRFTDNRFETQFGNFSAEVDQSGQNGVLVVRPEEIKLLPVNPGGDLAPQLAQVMAARMLGNQSQIHLRAFTPSGVELHLHVRENGVYLPKVGSMHRLVISPENVHLFVG